jgi:hypothetical protein
MQGAATAYLSVSFVCFIKAFDCGFLQLLIAAFYSSSKVQVGSENASLR